VEVAVKSGMTELEQALEALIARHEDEAAKLMDVQPKGAEGE
jgi:hypothetical protein